MLMFRATLLPQARIRARLLHPGQSVFPVIEFCAEDTHDAWSFIISHLTTRFPKASITSFDFIVTRI